MLVHPIQRIAAWGEATRRNHVQHSKSVLTLFRHLSPSFSLFPSRRSNSKLAAAVTNAGASTRVGLMQGVSILSQLRCCCILSPPPRPFLTAFIALVNDGVHRTRRTPRKVALAWLVALSSRLES